MKETLKMMKQIIIGYEGGKDINELIEEYKQTKAPNILAYLFKENYGLIYKTSLLYPILNESDIASFALQELDKCILNYNGTAKFATYFMVCLKNKLRAESEMLLHNNRKALLQYEDILNCNEVYYDDYFDINDFIKSNNLTDNEARYCELLNEGYSIKEIANIVKKSASFIYQENAKIKKKILNLV